MSSRVERLRNARLYLVCPCAAAQGAAAALRGGVDVIQLRDKSASDAELLHAAAALRPLCDDADALLILNDRPDLVEAAQADGVHVGQDDMSVREARAIVGADRIVGVSTHAPDDLARAAADGADYAGVGPVHATPTKPGRPAVGLDYVSHAAAHARLPWFAIGGVDLDTIDAVSAAGATRVAVVRAITQAGDPAAVARALRERLEAGVGVA